MFYLNIPNLTCYTKIGTKNFEKSKLSKIVVDIKIPITIPVENDSVESAYDYEKIANFTKNWLKAQEYNLLENLINDLAKAIKHEFKINSINIKIQKPYAVNLESHVEIEYKD